MSYIFQVVFGSGGLLLLVACIWRRKDREQYLRLWPSLLILADALLLVGVLGREVATLRGLGGLGVMIGAIGVFVPSLPLATIALGIALNLIVIFANGRMPVLAMSTPATDHHVPIMETTVLPWLGDIFTWDTAARISSFSIGDALVAVGLWWLATRIATLPRQT